MQVALKDIALNTTQRPVVVAVLDHQSGTASGVDLVARARWAVSHGADLVEVSDASASDELRQLHAEGICWAVATSNTDIVEAMRESGASLVTWHGETRSLAEVQALAGPLPVVSTQGPWRAHDWRAADFTNPQTTDVCSNSSQLQELSVPHERLLVIADLAALDDPAIIAAMVTLALEVGASAIRTVAPQPARRAAYVVRAIEAAK